MKTTLTILMAGMIFLLVPTMASARGDHDRERHGSYKVYVEKDHGQYRNKAWKKDVKRQYKQSRHKKHLRRELRQTRHELRQTKRELRRERRHDRRYDRYPYYVRSGVVFGVPQVVFRFNW